MSNQNYLKEETGRASVEQCDHCQNQERNSNFCSNQEAFTPSAVWSKVMANHSGKTFQAVSSQSEREKAWNYGNAALFGS